MRQEHLLEQTITEGLGQLRELLSRLSTRDVAGGCFVYYLRQSNDDRSAHRLLSPAKQIPFLLGVMLSEEEPAQPMEFSAEYWGRTTAILDSLFSAYMHLYLPENQDLSTMDDTWLRSREVSMLAFLHYFNTGILASLQQLAHRIETYLVPFDPELKKLLGISATEALSICQWVSDTMQGSLDDLQSALREERVERLELLKQAAAEDWSLNKIREAARDPAYYDLAKAEQILSGIQHLDVVDLRSLKESFAHSAEPFWRQFSIKRGEAPAVRYPTDESLFELRPLIRISDSKALCPVVNTLYSALLKVGERTLIQSRSCDRFLRHRDKSLERQALQATKGLLNPRAQVWSGAFETPDSQYEHDHILVDDEVCLVLEAKASPPIEPFRNPDKAYPRLQDAFRSDTGLQKAYEQTNRIVRRLRSGHEVPIYDARGTEIGRIEPNASRLTVGVCVTRDNFGPLATNLSLLLEKGSEDPYPWAVSIIDLEKIAEAWSYFGWGSKELRRYLTDRITLHGRVFSDDELDYAGFFLQHGAFEPVVRANVDTFHLSPHYSSIFDRLYRHLYCDAPPVTLDSSHPIILNQSPLFGEGTYPPDERKKPARHQRKVGRNEQCPCASGKKFKKCCGLAR